MAAAAAREDGRSTERDEEEAAPRSRYGAPARFFAWMIVPELLTVLALSALVNLSLKRLVLSAVAAFFLLLLPLSRYVPQGLLPLKGKWLRRMLAGLALLGMTYGGPLAVIKKVATYNWTVNQIQQGILRFAMYRPSTRLPVWLGKIELPRWIGGIPFSVLLGLAALLLLIQFKLLWDILGEERKRR